MVDITAFIRELLFGHDCVIVPGFGGFIGNYTPARVDRNSGTFYPPVKLISFNRNLNHNDGLLVGRISNSLNINYGDARTFVEKFVTDLRKKLDNGEKVVFDNIGSFINNHEGNVQFDPDRTANYHLDSYGLESFQCFPLEGYDVRKRIIKHRINEPAKQVSLRKILWRAAIIVPLLSVMVAVPLKTNLFKPKVEVSTFNPLVTAEFEQNKAAVDEIVKTESDKTTDSLNTIAEKIPAPQPTAENVIPATGRYHLITGSFKSHDNAAKQVNMLIAEGFTPEIVTAPNGFYRVSAMVCNDLSVAELKKDSISKKFPEAWISRKR
jgi:nucleoid DNA-binding protein